MKNCNERKADDVDATAVDATINDVDVLAKTDSTAKRTTKMMVLSTFKHIEYNNISTKVHMNMNKREYLSKNICNDFIDKKIENAASFLFYY